MRKHLSLLAGILLPAALLAQEKINMEVMQQIRTEALEHSGAAELAHQLTDIAGPRLTNSPGYMRAAKWAVQTLRQWGLNKAALEPWGVFGKGWSTEHVYAAIKKPYYQPLIAFPLAWSQGTKGLVTGNAILLDSMTITAIDRLGSNLRGKIVLLHTKDTLLKPAPAIYRYPDSVLNSLPDKYMVRRESLTRHLETAKLTAAAKKHLATKGVIALISLQGNGRDGTMEVNGHNGYAKGFELPVPELTVTKEDFLRISRLLRSSVPVNLELDIQNKWYTDDLNGYNVIGDITGTDPALKDEVVIAGGHLDSWHSGTGATDNGAGCVIMMEALRILKAIGVQPRRTIRIALWGGEEQGLYGSFNYVKKHYGNPADMQLLPAQQQVSAYFNLDNGSGKIRGIYLQQNDAAGPVFRSWLAPFADLGATGVTRSNTGSTDHLPFDAVGIPAFQFIQDPLEYETRTHHTNMDTYEHLSMDDIKQASAVMAAFLYNAAMRDEKLPRKPQPHAEQFVFDLNYPL
ncbi:M20/M25/M40 family metallo-hydrolase [Chitinophaga solisilvae]|uniref:M20/M25/M40 family metallo-hydrolase n=1 Tax=Chitinophaga solisilvae TaxID=1233460 RepID=UPI001371A188|nr:M20/M25/M40 family metallo-hydrolase [Chitinophaga solisilvae]